MNSNQSVQSRNLSLLCRYWIADTYDEAMAEGGVPGNIDKEFVRLWYAARCDPYADAEMPTPPNELLGELARRYLML